MHLLKYSRVKAEVVLDEVSPKVELRMYCRILAFMVVSIFAALFAAAGTPSKIYGVSLGSWSVFALYYFDPGRGTNNTDFGHHRLVLESWMLPAGKSRFL